MLPVGSFPLVPRSVADAPVGAPPNGDEFRTELLARTRTAATRSSAEVPVAHTPMSLDEVGSTLASAWKAMHGEDPPEGLIPILAGQVSIETGGGVGMLNNNFAGIKGTGPSGMSVRWRTTEGSGRSLVHVVDRFRAYRSAQEGASDYLHLLESRFGNALECAKTGDAGGFVHELKKAGYFTGDEKVYARVVGSVAARSSSVDGAALASPKPKPQSTAALASARPMATGQVQLPEAARHDDLGWISVMTTMSVADELARAAIRIAATEDDSRANSDMMKAMTS